MSTKEINELRDALKKIAEHEEKIAKLQTELKGINIEAIIKRLNHLSEELKSKADKSDIFKLESEKSDKITVESEFQRVWREIEQLKVWVSKLDESVTKILKTPAGNVSSEQLMNMVHRVEKLETNAVYLQKQIDELKNQKTTTGAGNTINFTETRESMGDDYKDLAMRIGGVAQDLEALKNEFSRWVKEF